MDPPFTRGFCVPPIKISNLNTTTSKRREVKNENIILFFTQYTFKNNLDPRFTPSLNLGTHSIKVVAGDTTSHKGES